MQTIIRLLKEHSQHKQMSIKAETVRSTRNWSKYPILWISFYIMVANVHIAILFQITLMFCHPIQLLDGTTPSLLWYDDEDHRSCDSDWGRLQEDNMTD